MKHIVVMGAGTGGLPAAYELRARLGAQCRITVINAVDYFQFVPSNPWVAVGWRKRGDTCFAMRPYLEKKGIGLIASPVQRIDAAASTLALANGETVSYDYLVITTGPKLAFHEVEGSGPDAHTQSICTIDHAEATWARYQQFLQAPGPVVVGAMPGASCFGPAYEFAFILNTDLRRRKLRNKVPMTFVTSEPYVGHMGLGGVGDSKGMLESELRNNDIKWITNAKVTRVEDGLMHVTQLDDHGQVLKEHPVTAGGVMLVGAILLIIPATRAAIAAAGALLAVSGAATAAPKSRTKDKK